ncbi:hypothetical protein MHBO_002092 [Bonamia ostreae]|uniref:Uncharacterized protein n=1 Tax=Bonamia ostreae TaxID=126728 RepID=A0ABV2ALR2_9EUKA
MIFILFNIVMSAICPKPKVFFKEIDISSQTKFVCHLNNSSVQTVCDMESQLPYFFENKSVSKRIYCYKDFSGTLFIVPDVVKAYRACTRIDFLPRGNFLTAKFGHCSQIFPDLYYGYCLLLEHRSKYVYNNSRNRGLWNFLCEDGVWKLINASTIPDNLFCKRTQLKSTEETTKPHFCQQSFAFESLFYTFLDERTQKSSKITPLDTLKCAYKGKSPTAIVESIVKNETARGCRKPLVLPQKYAVFVVYDDCLVSDDLERVLSKCVATLSTGFVFANRKPEQTLLCGEDGISPRVLRVIREPLSDGCKVNAIENGSYIYGCSKEIERGICKYKCAANFYTAANIRYGVIVCTRKGAKYLFDSTPSCDNQQILQFLWIVTGISGFLFVWIVLYGLYFKEKCCFKPKIAEETKVLSLEFS